MATLKKIIFVLGILLTVAVQAQTPVKIIINTPFNTPDENIYLTGDFPQCKWQAQCLKMNKIAENQFEMNLNLVTGEYAYKITRGNWSHEASDAHSLPLDNSHFKVESEEQTVIQNIVNWSDLGELGTTGQIVHVKKIFSPQLNNDRELQIRLPKGYKDSDKHYPVIYMHDGQNVFNPKTSKYGVDWSVDEVLEKLEDAGEVPQAIVVGVYHLDRAQEYNDEDQGEHYAQFLVETIKPYIDQHYKTLPDREHTFLMGSSYGSVISFTTLWRYPNIFSKAAGLAFNAHFFEDMPFKFLEKFPSYNTQYPVALYLDHGTEGLDSEFEPYTKDFVKKIIATGLPSSLLNFRIFPYTDHTETDWARRVHIPLKFLLLKQ